MQWRFLGLGKHPAATRDYRVLLWPGQLWEPASRTGCLRHGGHGVRWGVAAVGQAEAEADGLAAGRPKIRK